MDIHFRKRIYKLLLFILIAALLMQAVSASAAIYYQSPLTGKSAYSSGKVIKVGFYEMPGFNNKDSDGNYSGYGPDYLRELCKYTGWRIEYVEGSLEVLNAKLSSGIIDLLGGIPKAKAYEQYCSFPELQAGSSYTALLARSDDERFNYGDIHYFDGVRVGAIKGDATLLSFNLYCQSYGVTPLKSLYDDSEKLHAALKLGAVDGILTSSLGMNGEFKLIAKFAPSPFYFVTTRNNMALLDELNLAQEQLRLDNPQIEMQLLNKYYASFEQASIGFTREELKYIERSDVVNVLCTESMKPIQYYDETSGEFMGVTTDILKWISSYSGLKFNFVRSGDYEHADELIRTDAVAVLCNAETDSDVFNITKPYISSSLVLITRSSMALTDVKSVKLMPHAYSAEYAARQYYNMDVQYAKSDRECYDSFFSGETDAIICNTYVANVLFAEDDSNGDKYTATSIPNCPQELCFSVFSQQNPLLFSVLNKSIAAMPDSERNDIILRNTSVRPEDAFSLFLKSNPYLIPLVVVLVLGAVIIVMLVIMSNTRKRNEEIQRLLYQDPVTGLYNFHKFELEANAILSEPREGNRYVFLYLNIERFRFINEAYGRNMGDEVLRYGARVLMAHAEPGELYAREHSDKFVLLFTFTDKPALAERLRSMDERFQEFMMSLINTKLILTCTAYILKPDDNDISIIFERANQVKEAMSEAYMSRIVYHSASIYRKVKEEEYLGKNMLRALNQQEFVPFFQPKVDVNTDELVGAEALVRWVHPKRGLLQPGSFLPFFERNGFIVNIDLSVFEQTCRMLRSRIDAGKPPICVASNFSRLHLYNPGFPQTVKSIADEYGIDTKYLELEITETVAVRNIEVTISCIQELKRMGFKIAVDDFGSGYSSLGLLSRIECDVLKLDKSFFRMGELDTRKTTVLQSVIALAKALNLEVVCEGIENEMQVELIKSFGCSVAQGFYYARPLPLSDFDLFALETVVRKL